MNYQETVKEPMSKKTRNLFIKLLGVPFEEVNKEGKVITGWIFQGEKLYGSSL